MSEPMPENTSQAPLVEQPGWDAMLEDLIGLNIRGLRTIGTLLAAPKQVFAAAKAKDWMGRKYTPSLRLFVSLLMVVSLLQAFWAGPNSLLSRIQTEAIQAQINADAPAELQPFINSNDIWQTMLVGLPISTLIAMLVASLLLRVWGPEAKTVTRVRYYFLAIIPGWICSFALSMTLDSIPEQAALAILPNLLFIVLLVDGSTAWRGNPGNYSGFARIWRAVFFGVVNFAVYIMANIILSRYAGFIVGNEAVAAAEAAGVVLSPS